MDVLLSVSSPIRLLTDDVRLLFLSPQEHRLAWPCVVHLRYEGANTAGHKMLLDLALCLKGFKVEKYYIRI